MTYSIVARDPSTGELGVAVQSHFFATGAIVPWVRAGVGAVATQAMAELSYGPRLLDRLGGGASPAAALTGLVADDPGGPTRQVAVVDAAGAVAVHTGDRCIVEAGHVAGDGWSVQANMMSSPGVPEAMAGAFTATSGDLPTRMLAALDAAEAAGGDLRGRQSAALVVAAGEVASPPWDHRYSVRVDDHADPLAELRRLVELRRAYRNGDASAAVLGDNPELRFWAAVQLAVDGQVDQARQALDAIHAGDDRWRELLRRLPAAALLPDDPELLRALAD